MCFKKYSVLESEWNLHRRPEKYLGPNICAGHSKNPARYFLKLGFLKFSTAKKQTLLFSSAKSQKIQEIHGGGSCRQQKWGQRTYVVDPDSFARPTGCSFMPNGPGFCYRPSCLISNVWNLAAAKFQKSGPKSKIQVSNFLRGLNMPTKMWARLRAAHIIGIHLFLNLMFAI